MLSGIKLCTGARQVYNLPLPVFVSSAVGSVPRDLCLVAGEFALQNSLVVLLNSNIFCEHAFCNSKFLFFIEVMNDFFESILEKLRRELVGCGRIRDSLKSSLSELREESELLYFEISDS